MERSFSAGELLAVWEQGYGQPAARRALLLLSVASPDSSLEALAGLSVGQRDGRLLTLREQLFGPRLNSMVNCPDCSRQLELAFQVADVRLADTGNTADEFSMSVSDYEVRFRLPNSLDLLAIDPGAEVTAVRQQLLERCLIEARHHGETHAATQLPEPVMEAVAERMAAADPQAEMLINLDCPACGHEWQALFDVGSFLWQELTTWAIRTLREVHELASAYGWRENDILTMSQWRRQLYLQMVSG